MGASKSTMIISVMGQILNIDTIMYFQNDSFIRFRENIIACGRIKLYIRKNSIKKIKY